MSLQRKVHYIIILHHSHFSQLFEYGPDICLPSSKNMLSLTKIVKYGSHNDLNMRNEDIMRVLYPFVCLATNLSLSLSPLLFYLISSFALALN